MEPVRVKAYGLVPMTKRTYLSWQSAGAVILLVLYWTADLVPFPPTLKSYWRPLILLTAVADVAETAVMLWRFSVAERRARAAHPQPPPLP